MDKRIEVFRDKSNPKRNMYCLDDDETQIDIYGDENDKNYQRLEIIAVPCNYLHEEYGYTEDSINKDCVANLTS